MPFDEKIGILSLNKYDLIDILLGRKKIKTELPEDLHILNCNYNYKNCCVEIVCCSQTFTVKPRGVEVPLIQNIELEDAARRK